DVHDADQREFRRVDRRRHGVRRLRDLRRPGRRHGVRAAVTARVATFDPLFPAADADAMIALCERFGSYGMYGQTPIEEELGRGLYQRHDAAMNFIRTGGR